ncbi:hypothetical protein Btru_070147 [Bulinus truncatus]|nr:hypothetical protein Btru_070147 [Bulinus truncatus]
MTIECKIVTKKALTIYDPLSIKVSTQLLNSYQFRASIDCNDPVVDPTTQLVDINRTFAQYVCRAGYRVESGDLQRLCDANGTWSGSPPVCVVDSVMPKAYLVILIVGATVAVFLACIPYDFYRFRKRKKKVRDHQERLSLVTRIAPGHAKVIIETVALEPEVASNPHQRRFGLKSLFSVFRFVGGKMKAGQGAPDASPHPLCPEVHAEPLSGSDVGPESDGLTASSFVFPSNPASTGRSSGNDGLESCDEDAIDKSPWLSASADEYAAGTSESGLESQASCSGTIPGAAAPSASVVDAGAKKAYFMFQKANEIFSQQLTAMRQEANDGSGRASTWGPISEPAVVQVTCLNDDARQDDESSAHSDLAASGDELGNSPAASSPPPSSSSSQEASSPLTPTDRAVGGRRTMPSRVTSITYHSMPSIAGNSSSPSN